MAKIHKIPSGVINFGERLAVRFAGQSVNGAYRWIQVGGFSFQAVELIKFTLLIWLASFLALKIKEGKLKNSKDTLKTILIALVTIGVVVAGITE